jgi:hypothetical protein
MENSATTSEMDNDRFRHFSQTAGIAILMLWPDIKQFSRKNGKRSAVMDSFLTNMRMVFSTAPRIIYAMDTLL